MADKKSESGAAVEERDEMLEKHLENASTEVDETSTGNTTEGDDSEASDTGDADNQSEPDEAAAETERINALVEKLAQSKKDKELKPIREQLGSANNRISELESLLMDRTIDEVFEEETEALGEDEAERRRDRRQQSNKAFKEMLSSQQKLQQLLKSHGAADVDEMAGYYNGVARDQMGWAAIRALMFPEDKPKLQKMQKYVERISQANDKTEYDLIMEGIQAALKADSGQAKNRHKPDSARGEGSGQFTREQIRNMTPAEYAKNRDKIIAAQNAGLLR